MADSSLMPQLNRLTIFRAFSKYYLKFPHLVYFFTMLFLSLISRVFVSKYLKQFATYNSL